MASNRFASAPLLVAALCLCVHGAHAANKTIDLTTLILTVPGWPLNAHVETVLRAYGAPYEVRPIAYSERSYLNVTALLTNADGSGKYGFIIVSPAEVINIWGRVLDLNQVNQIYAYQEKFGVRMTAEAPYVPSVADDIPGGPLGLGVRYVVAGSPGNSPNIPNGAGAVDTTAPLTISGVKAGAPVDYSGLFLTPVTITDTNRTKAALTCTSPSSHAGVTAVTSKFPTGREQFTTFFPCAAFSADCLLVAHLYLAWGLHGILPGARDSLFSVQVDGLFLATTEPFNSSASYRMTARDAQNIAAFAANVPGIPADSSFKVELAYNNGGYIQATQLAKFAQTFPAVQAEPVPQTFQKPPGSGADLLPANPNISWWDSEVWKQDALFNEVAYGPSGEQFFLSQQTFTPLVLNNVTYHDALQQIQLNQAAAASWNTSHINRFSQTAIVTPGISGLRNVDALRALMDAGITAAVGDTSWPHLRNQANPWQAQVLSKAANATVDGFYILPRSPTEVYYGVSTEAVEAQLYNSIYCCNSANNPSCPTDSCESGKPFAKPSTWSDILAREQIRVTHMLMALRPDGHMFHQANCRTDAGATNKSLLQQWIQAAVDAYSARVSWPLQSLKLDEQLAFAKKRIQRDACGLKYTLSFDDVTKSASALTIKSSGGGCDAPVMIGSTAVTGATGAPRVLGSEPPLYTATVAAGGSKTLALGSGIQWA